MRILPHSGGTGAMHPHLDTVLFQIYRTLGQDPSKKPETVMDVVKRALSNVGDNFEAMEHEGKAFGAVGTWTGGQAWWNYMSAFFFTRTST